MNIDVSKNSAVATKIVDLFKIENDDIAIESFVDFINIEHDDVVLSTFVEEMITEQNDITNEMMIEFFIIQIFKIFESSNKFILLFIYNEHFSQK